MGSYDESIFNSILEEADKKQGGFSNVLSIFNDKVTPRPKADKDKKKQYT